MIQKSPSHPHSDQMLELRVGMESQKKGLSFYPLVGCLAEMEFHKDPDYRDHLLSFRLPDVGRAFQDFMRTREVAEFFSGAMAGAMTKAVLAPLETIRRALLFFFSSCFMKSLNLSCSFHHLY